MEPLEKELVEYYQSIACAKLLWGTEFGSAVKTLKSMIQGKCKDGQELIDGLTETLKDPSLVKKETPQFLTAVVQALHNLDYGVRFVIDTSRWVVDDYSGVWHLEARPRPWILEPEISLTLELDGYFEWAGVRAKYINLILHGTIENCGFGAENSIFTLMPGAMITNYEAEPSKGNVLRRMNEKGEFEIISS